MKAFIFAADTCGPAHFVVTCLSLWYVRVDSTPIRVEFFVATGLWCSVQLGMANRTRWLLPT